MKRTGFFNWEISVYDMMYVIIISGLQVHTVIPAEVLTGIGSAIAFVLIIVIIMVALFYPKVKLIALSRLPNCHLDDIGKYY
jgi:hypothetical protein